MKELQGPSDDFMKQLGFQPIRTATRQSIAVVKASMNGERLFFETAWPRLNRQLLSGLQPGKLYIIGGRPGTGKSAFSNQLIFDALDRAAIYKRNVAVFYWSFEMPGYQQLLRTASKTTHLQLADLYSVDQVLGKKDFDRFVQSVTPYAKYPIYFRNKAVNAKQIQDSCTIFAEKYPDTQIINLIDHSRLVPGQEDKETERLNTLSKACMGMQSNLNVINILLSQLNRNIEKEDRAKNQYQPLLSDLFGGDSVGQDAHVVMIIQRPNDLYGITAKYCGEEPVGLLAVHLEKNRDGFLGMVPFDFDGSTFTITERIK
jgi:replicative DNA helicase